VDLHRFPKCLAPLAPSRTVPITRQPSLTYWRANSKPIPRLAPVIRTVGMARSVDFAQVGEAVCDAGYVCAPTTARALMLMMPRAVNGEVRIGNRNFKRPICIDANVSARHRMVNLRVVMNSQLFDLFIRLAQRHCFQKTVRPPRRAASHHFPKHELQREIPPETCRTGCASYSA
jgi:hypothetical protein